MGAVRAAALSQLLLLAAAAAAVAAGAAAPGAAAASGGGVGCEPALLEEPIAEASVPAAVRQEALAAARAAAAAAAAGAGPGAEGALRAVLRDHPRVAAAALVLAAPPGEGAGAGAERTAVAVRAAGDAAANASASASVDGDAGGADVDALWRTAANQSDAWTPPLRDCRLAGDQWLFGLTAPLQPQRSGWAAVFLPLVELLHCNESVGAGHSCDPTSTECMPAPRDPRGYVCRCRPDFWRGFLSEGGGGGGGGDGGGDGDGDGGGDGFGDPYSCVSCAAEGGGDVGGCAAKGDPLLRAVVLGVQLLCMSITVLLAGVVFRQRKCKAIATGMWTILETILLGIFLLYSTVVVRFFDPSVVQCLIEPWVRELGFVICYGAIILKLYRILIEFRTRKAHRWVVRDKDLLKYLLAMVIIVLGYMAAWTASNLNFIQENYSVLAVGRTADGARFLVCKALWWDYVTETGEMLILLFGLHLSFAARNAATQFQERRFLCLAIAVEAAVSGAFYALRVALHATLHPDYAYLAYFARSQLTSTAVLLLIFMPKLWYQQRGTRHYLPQELCARAPLDAFRPQDGAGDAGGAGGGAGGAGAAAGAGAGSDADVGEINLADMNPEDIRAELKRLYTQLEVLKNKTIRADNPHISKRRGGRKVAHRRFSLQKKGSREKALHHRNQRCSMRHSHADGGSSGGGSGGGGGGGGGGAGGEGEGEVSRTPEDSVCSNEGPSAIYNDGPSTYSDVGTPNVSFRVSPRQ